MAAHEKLREAKEVIVVGGGYVGMELVAEVVSYFPKTKVTLVEGLSTLVFSHSINKEDCAKMLVHTFV